MLISPEPPVFMDGFRHILRGSKKPAWRALSEIGQDRPGTVPGAKMDVRQLESHRFQEDPLIAFLW